MEYRTFYELMDDYEDTEFEPAAGPADPRRVAARTLTRLGPRQTVAPKRRRPVRVLRTALIAAALVLCLSVTAYAVYQWRVEDYVIGQPTPMDQVLPEDSQLLSLVGYQGSPEYEAYSDWNAYLAEDPVDYAALGQDDSWHETEENYWGLYQAVTDEQAEKLDAIAAEHGLTLHTYMVPQSSEQLYDTLGTDPFIDGAYDLLSGYVYEDGAFALDGNTADGFLFQMFTNVKGSFAMVSSAIGPDYEEWSYETAGGETVDLVLESGGFGDILFETDGAYVFTRAAYDWLEGDAAHITKAELEDFADTIDFAVLAARFDGTEHADTAAAVAALAEDARQAREQEAADAAAQDEQVLADLGDWRFAAPPEGFDLLWTNPMYGVMTAFIEGEDGYLGDSVDSCYVSEDGSERLFLSYRRLYAGEDRTEQATQAAFDALASDSGSQTCEAAGCPAVFRGELDTQLYWLDESRGLLFQLTCEREGSDGLIQGRSQEELISLAETLIAGFEN